jgi:hypothetical protein
MDARGEGRARPRRALERAKAVIEEVHALARERVKALEDGFQGERRATAGSLEWANNVIRSVKALRDAFPFDDVRDALSDLEARAATILGAVPPPSGGRGRR